MSLIKTIPCSIDIIKTGHYAYNTKCVKSFVKTIINHLLCVINSRSDGNQSL